MQIVDRLQWTRLDYTTCVGNMQLRDKLARDGSPVDREAMPIAMREDEVARSSMFLMWRDVELVLSSTDSASVL